MKIKKIKIKDYRIFDNIEFNFTDNNGKALDKIILAGINGTGKTTFFDLIISAFVENIKNINYADADFFELNVELLPDELKYFNNFKEKKEDINFCLKKNILELSTEEVEVYTGLDRFTMYNLDTIKPFKEFILKNNFGFKIAYFHDFTTTLATNKNNVLKLLEFNKFEENLEEYYNKVITKQLFENRNLTAAEVIQTQIRKINNLLKNIDTISKIDDIDNNKLIFKNFKGDKLLLRDLSSGEKQLFYRASYLSALDLNNSIILVDEPELSLHPTWQSNVLKLYENIGENNQIIMATHSPHIISSVDPQNLFILNVGEKDKKITVTNMKSANRYSKGVELNSILMEIMGTPLRDFETLKEIEYIADNLDEEYNSTEFIEKIEKLREKLGPQDPFIIRLNHQLLLKQK